MRAGRPRYGVAPDFGARSHHIAGAFGVHLGVDRVILCGSPDFAAYWFCQRGFVMLNRAAPESLRQPKTVTHDADLVIVGGGVAGTCAAVTAARQGLKVVLVQDRPVLGGNASSEVRLWVLGATTHMGSNNRYAREGGLINDLLVENMYRNPEGNPLIFDTILLEYVANEPNITLLLNTSAFEVTKHPENADRIASVRAFCSQNSTMYVLRAPYFCDSSGDGIVGFLAGAAFRMGAESKEEFGEAFAPTGEFGFLLGHSMYFYTKDVGRPVTFVPPAFALKNIPEKIPRFRSFNTREQGCRLWWIEYGGRLDTVHDSEQIKWELWKVVYGVWDYIKNSGNFPEAANLALEWVSHIPGKRESRRFEGDYMLTQQDVVQRRLHEDAVSFGGWSIDLHPADGVFSEMKGSHHLHSKGPYQIPYRCLYSRNVENLFIVGRIASSSHVAFGSTRVIATCSLGAQAIAMAAAMCKQQGCLPRDISRPEQMKILQRRLQRSGQHIWSMALDDPRDLVRKATVIASSSLALQTLPADGPLLTLANHSVAQLLPLQAGKVPAMTVTVDADAATTLTAELRVASRLDHHTPDVTLAAVSVPLQAGKKQAVKLAFDASLERDRYVFLVLLKNEHVAAHGTNFRATGLLSLRHRRNETTSHVGGEDYEVWVPARRPEGHNLALELSSPVKVFGPGNLTNGIDRPTHLPNGWVASPGDESPAVTVTWGAPQTISRLDLALDVDYDHAMESALMGHPERTMPFCLKRYRVTDASGATVHTCEENHHATNSITFDPPLKTTGLTIHAMESNVATVPANIFSVRAYATAAPE
jgi:hypothetical protein